MSPRFSGTGYEHPSYARSSAEPGANGSLRALAEWLTLRRQAAVFVQVDRGGGIAERRLTPQAARLVFRRRCERAVIELFSPHDFRSVCLCRSALRGG